MLTSDQVADALFGSPTTARHRLTQLHRLRVVQRFSPFVSKGSAPYHYVLDRLGAEVVAAERGEEPKKLWRQDRSLVLARSRTLERIVAINGFFTALMGEARRWPASRLHLWWSAARCAEWVGDLVKPDGYGVWEGGRRTLDSFLEWDRGEPAGDWAETLVRHADLADALERHVWVLVVVGTPTREAELRRCLDGAGLAFATAVNGPDEPSLAGRWLTHDGNTRTSLLALGPAQGRPLQPFGRPSGSSPDWLYRERAPRPSE